MPEQSNGSSRRFQRPPVVEENKSPDEGHVQVGRFAVSPPLDAEFDPLPLHKRCSATIEASTRSRKHLTEVCIFQIPFYIVGYVELPRTRSADRGSLGAESVTMR